MTAILERLQTLLVRDIMSTNAAQVSESDSLSSATAAMLERMISGLPVVDSGGRCIGMLTAFDFVRHVAAESEGSHSTTEGSPEGNETVAQNMHVGVQSVAQDTTLLEAARQMCAQHVHRLPVLDAGGRVEGIVTSLDIVAALVNAADEHSHSPKHSSSRGGKR